MSFIGNIFGGAVNAERQYNVSIEYKCLNCGEVIYQGPQIVTIKLKKSDTPDDILYKITEKLLYPYAKDSHVYGFIIPHDSEHNRTFFAVYPHRCKDGKIGISTFSSFNFAQIDTKLDR